MKSEERQDSEPRIRGRLWISTHLEYGDSIAVDIVGDPEGLRSLGQLLIFLADSDQSLRGVPRGEHDHIHLDPKRGLGFGDLGGYSCKVELCRADACGTGEIYPYLEAADQDSFGYEPDVIPPAEWLQRATAALQLARAAEAGSLLQREQVPMLAGQSAFCSLMAGLRTLDVVVPSLVEGPSDLLEFLPDNLALPIDIDGLSDVLSAEPPVPAFTCNPLPTEEEIDTCLDVGERMLAWAEELAGLIG